MDESRTRIVGVIVRKRAGRQNVVAHLYEDQRGTISTSLTAVGRTDEILMTSHEGPRAARQLHLLLARPSRAMPRC